MTGLRITINAAELADAIDGLAAIMRRPEPVMNVIGEAMEFSTIERQRRGVAPDGTAWPSLSPGYAAAKRGAETLRETGRLMGSLSRRVRGNQVVVGTNVIYAAIHQFGGTIRPKKGKRLAFRLGKLSVFARSVSIPARPFLGISADDRAEIVEIFRDFAARATRRS
jgi:phage virion morphogenesis protein